MARRLAMTCTSRWSRTPRRGGTSPWLCAPASGTTASPSTSGRGAAGEGVLSEKKYIIVNYSVHCCCTSNPCFQEDCVQRTAARVQGGCTQPHRYTGRCTGHQSKEPTHWLSFSFPALLCCDVSRAFFAVFVILLPTISQ